MVFKRYDSDNDGRLTYKEFSELLIPKDVILGNKVVSRQDIRLSSDALDSLRRLIKAVLNVEQSHEYLRLRLQKQLRSLNSSLVHAFTIIDSGRKGYLS